MLDPQGRDYGRMKRRRDNWHFLLILGSIVALVIFLVILPHLL
jgi:hypothetical protein